VSRPPDVPFSWSNRAGRAAGTRPSLTADRDDRESVGAQTARDPGGIAEVIRSTVEDHPDMPVCRENLSELRVNLVLIAGHDDQPALRSALGLPRREPRRG
jgi:hypothetical protein